MKPYLTIRNWSVEDRPRERLLEKGARQLSDAELLAILINTGTGKETAVDLAKRLLFSVDHQIQALARLSAEELQSLRGIGTAKAVTLMAAVELGRRACFDEVTQGLAMTSSKDVFAIIRPVLASLVHEEFWVLYLNRGNKVMAKEKMSSGGTSGTVTDVKMIVRKAVNKLADGLVIAHNHPSGNRFPSKEDHAVTKKIQDAVKYFDIRLLDHLIVAGDTYYSFADEGLL